MNLIPAKFLSRFRAAHLSVFALSLLLLSGAHAAIVAHFDFDGDLNNNISGSISMAAVEGTSSPTTFTPTTAYYNTDTIFGVTSSYISLDTHQGLDVDITAGLSNKSNYTIIMDVRSSQISSYNKLISLDGGTSDWGVYFVSNGVNFYPVGTGDPITANQWVRIALTYDGSTMSLFYGDDQAFALAATLDTTDPYYTLDNIVQFAKDDSGTGYGEDYPVDIANIWIDDVPMSLEQIDPGSNPTIPEPSQASLIFSSFALAWGFFRRTTR